MGATITISYDAVLGFFGAVIIGAISWIIISYFRNSEKLDKINGKISKFDNDLALLKQDHNHLKEEINRLQPNLENYMRDKIIEMKLLRANLKTTKFGGKSILEPE